MQTLKGEFSNAVNAFEERIGSLNEEITNYMSAGPYGSEENTLPVPGAFQTLYEESIGEGDGFAAIQNAAENLAQKTAQILSALTGDDVTASTGDDGKAGFIQIGSSEFNVVGDLEDGDIKFSTQALEVPEVELVPFMVQEKDGVRPDLPQWMIDADYPVEYIDKPLTFWEKTKKWFGENLVNPIKKAFDDPVGFAVDAVKKPFEDAWNGAKKVWNGIKSIF